MARFAGRAEREREEEKRYLPTGLPWTTDRDGIVAAGGVDDELSTALKRLVHYPLRP